MSHNAVALHPSTPRHRPLCSCVCPLAVLDMSDIAHFLLLVIQFNGFLLILFTLAALITIIIITFYFRSQPVQQPPPPPLTPPTAVRPLQLVVGFFHPYCDSGGGGERVLWKCIAALHALSPTIHCLVYTGDTTADADILDRACKRFNLPLFQRRIEFVRLTNRQLLEATNYPRFTMLFQSVASLRVAYSALLKRKPHIWFDSTGFAFTYPLAGLVFGCKVMTYTHYPTISTDMLQLVYSRRPTYNNSAEVTASTVSHIVKLVYYSVFTFLYFLVGQCASVVMVNSTWTQRHIRTLWLRTKRSAHIVYPPCDTATLQSLPLLSPVPLAEQSAVGENGKSGCRRDMILSVGQFRPEKDHELQLRAFALFRRHFDQQHQIHLIEHVKLVLAGGARGADDEKRVERLKRLAEELEIPQRCVEFRINEPFAVLQQLYGEALVGLHTMWNEHFGMGVVEMAAAGMLVIAHNSGGPREDIIVAPSTLPTQAANGRGKRSLHVRQASETVGRYGLLAASVEEYSACMQRVFGTDWKDSSPMRTMREEGRRYCCSEFSDERFQERFTAVVSKHITAMQQTLQQRAQSKKDK